MLSDYEKAMLLQLFSTIQIEITKFSEKSLKNQQRLNDTDLKSFFNQMQKHIEKDIVLYEYLWANGNYEFRKKAELLNEILNK